MRIGIDIRVIGKNRTGDEVYFFNLVKNLAATDKKNEFHLYVDRDPENDAGLAEEIRKLNLGANFQIDFIKKTNRFCWNFWYLPMHLRKNPVDIFHTQYIAPFWLPKNTKLVLTIHDISFNFFPEYIKKLDLFFLKTLLARGIRRADKIITVSASERRQIVDFYKIPLKKVDFTYDGVDFEKFSQNFSDEQKNAIRAKYKLPRKFLLYLGTLQPRKNIPVIVEALKNLDIKLVLAGNWDAHNFDKKIDEAIEKNGLRDKIIFPGWIDEGDKPALLQMAECFIFPSLYEGFGIPIIEAMAAGLPVVCSDIPVLREIGKDAALFCDSKDNQQFAENISKIMTDQLLREKLVRSGIENARNFAWRKTTEKTLKIYTSLA